MVEEGGLAVIGEGPGYAEEKVKIATPVRTREVAVGGGAIGSSNLAGVVAVGVTVGAGMTDLGAEILGGVTREVQMGLLVGGRLKGLP